MVEEAVGLHSDVVLPCITIQIYKRLCVLDAKFMPKLIMILVPAYATSELLVDKSWFLITWFQVAIGLVSDDVLAPELIKVKVTVLGLTGS